jgi:hypothetical protein
MSVVYTGNGRVLAAGIEDDLRYGIVFLYASSHVVI